MSWALIEIVVPLVLALGLGALASWVVFAWRRPVVTAEEWTELADRVANAEDATLAAEVQVGELEAEVAALRHERDELQNQTKPARKGRKKGKPPEPEQQSDAVPADTAPANTVPANTVPTDTVPADTVAQIETLQRDLARARAKADELKTARRQIAELEDEVAEGKQANADLAAAQLRIRAYERELSRGVSGPAPDPESLAGSTLTIAPVSHADDLKVVNGIGPKIERLLQESGITAWEQLAELSDRDIQHLEHDLGLSGRIGRDRWVSQATELIERYPDPAERPTK